MSASARRFSPAEPRTRSLGWGKTHARRNFSERRARGGAAGNLIEWLLFRFYWGASFRADTTVSEYIGAGGSSFAHRGLFLQMNMIFENVCSS